MLRFIRHPANALLDLISAPLVKAFGMFLGAWLTGACMFYLLGHAYSINRELVLPDGSLDFNNYSFINCMFLAAMVVSTMGYADVAMLNRFPAEGRDVIIGFTIGYALMAYVLVVYATAQIVSYVVEGALGRYLERRRMERNLKSMTGHQVVCGLGTTGTHIIQELTKMELEVVGLDQSEAQVAALGQAFPEGVFFVGDGTKDEDLRKAGVERAAGVFSALSDDKDNIITVLSVRELNRKVRVVARATNVANVPKLKQVGATATISPNHIGGLRMASEMLRPAVVTFLDAMMRHKEQAVRFDEVAIRPGSPSTGQSLGQVNIRGRLGLLPVAVVKGNGAITYNPEDTTVLEGGDSVVAIMTPVQRRALDRLLNPE